MTTTIQRSVTPARITSLELFDVFVFGSNLAGIHGAGAAKQALKWGATPGVGLGHAGKTWAIPTKDHGIRTLPLEAIQAYVTFFLREAGINTHRRYLVTAIGCGLAGYTPRQIAPLFFRDGPPPPHIHLPESFWSCYDHSQS